MDDALGGDLSRRDHGFADEDLAVEEFGGAFGVFEAGVVGIGGGDGEI